jgi:hypothetical protein
MKQQQTKDGTVRRVLAGQLDHCRERKEIVMVTDKSREQRLRRLAHRLGYRVEKRRGKYNNWCGPNYMVIEDATNIAKCYSSNSGTYSITLDDVEKFLKGEEVRR